MFDVRASIWDTLDFGSAESAEADELRSALLADEAEISEIRARQVERLRRADRLQLDTADGSRNMADWVVANLDVSPQTARRMMRSHGPITAISTSGWQRASSGSTGPHFSARSGT